MWVGIGRRVGSWNRSVVWPEMNCGVLPTPPSTSDGRVTFGDVPQVSQDSKEEMIAAKPHHLRSLGGTCRLVVGRATRLFQRLATAAAPPMRQLRECHERSFEPQQRQTTPTARPIAQKALLGVCEIVGIPTNQPASTRRDAQLEAKRWEGELDASPTSLTVTSHATSRSAALPVSEPSRRFGHAASSGPTMRAIRPLQVARHTSALTAGS